MGDIREINIILTGDGIDNVADVVGILHHPLLRDRDFFVAVVRQSAEMSEVAVREEKFNATASQASYFLTHVAKTNVVACEDRGG